MKKIVVASLALVTIPFFSAAAPQGPATCGPGTGIDFQMVPDQFVFVAGVGGQIRFLVINTAGKPTYFFRPLGSCDGGEGGYSFEILPRVEEHRSERHAACGGIPGWNAIKALADPKTGILLNEHEVYGKDESFRVPLKKGIYRLTAKLCPAHFTEKEREALAEAKMHVLDCVIQAPEVKISVK